MMKLLHTFTWALTALAASTVSFAAESPTKPNIIVILADDLGWGELGAQGNKQIPTPHIDSIANGGVKFTQGYVSGPYCSPTRAGLLTGRYQTRFGHEWNPPQDAEAGLPLDQKTIANHLKQAGYKTGVVGKWHLGVDPKFRPSERGFDEFYGTLANSPYRHPQLVDTRISNDPVRVEDDEFYTTKAYGKRAVEFINEHRDEPFFLYLPFNAQHGPLQATGADLERFPNIKKKKRKTFAAMLASHDDAVGSVLEALRDNNLEENTLVIYLTDNGGPTQQTTSSNRPLRGFKSTTLEGGVRVPFYVQWKGQLPAGTVYEHPIIQLDILPTALAAAGQSVDPAWQLDGVNLLPYLKGEAKEPPHDAFYWRFGQQWAIRHGDWKLVASRLDGPEAKLFNLKDDIGEANDLSAANPAKVEELRGEWETWDAKNVPAKWQPPQNKKRKQQQKAARTT